LFAQNLAVPAQTGVINGAGQTFVINFTPGADTGGFDFVLNAVPAANLTITAAAATIPNGTTVCSNTASSVSCFSNANSPTVDLGAGTVTVTYTGGATVGAIALNFGMANFFSQAGPAEPGTTTNGTLTLNAGPSGPTLTYTPAAATAIVVPASISGTALTTTIAVASAGGDTGETTTLACSVSGTGYVSTVTGSPFAGGTTSAGSVGLGCAGTAAAQTLTCTQTRSGTGGGAPVVSTWPLTCAAAPGFASTPPDGGTVNIVGITGSTATGSVNVSNPGTAPLTISGCAVTGTGLTLGTVSASVASGGTGAIGVSCAVPAQAGTTLTGTLQCNTNAAAPADVINYNISCLAQSASIPTLGFGGKALMVLLMLGFGLVGFQLYRRSA
jgi:hypothetical protein